MSGDQQDQYKSYYNQSGGGYGSNRKFQKFNHTNNLIFSFFIIQIIKLTFLIL